MLIGNYLKQVIKTNPKHFLSIIKTPKSQSNKVRRLRSDYAGNSTACRRKTPLPSLSLAPSLSHSLSHGWLGRTALSPSPSLLFPVWFGQRKHSSPLFLTLESGWARGKPLSSLFFLFLSPLFSSSLILTHSRGQLPLTLGSPSPALFSLSISPSVSH
jgi:hypothetical protein